MRYCAGTELFFDTAALKSSILRTVPGQLGETKQCDSDGSNERCEMGGIELHLLARA